MLYSVQVIPMGNSLRMLDSKQPDPVAPNAEGTGAEGQDVQPEPYDIAAIRSLLRDTFTADDLWRFCHERPVFKPIHGHFERNPSLEVMIDVLIEYCEKRRLLDELISEVQKYSQDTPPGLPPPPEQQPNSVQMTMIIEEGASATDVSMAGRDASRQTTDSHMTTVPGRMQTFVRAMSLAASGLGLVGGALWLWKAIPGFTLEFLVPLLIIITVLILGVIGLLLPSLIVGIFGSSRGSGRR